MMEATVRWVFQRQDGGDGAQKPSLCLEGRRWMFCIAAGHPVRVLRRKLEEGRRYRSVVVPPGNEPYSPMTAAQRLHDIGSRNGITETATRLLRLVLEAEDSSAFVDEEAIEDEETLAMTGPENAAPMGEETTSGNGHISNGETTVSTKKTTTTKAPAKKSTTAKTAPVVKAKAKAAPVVKAKAPAKERAPRTTHAKLPKRKSEGETPFRAGTAKEKAFLLYKDQHGKYAEMSKEQKGEWAEKHAAKLGIAASTLRSWISGQFTVALKA